MKNQPAVNWYKTFNFMNIEIETGVHGSRILCTLVKQFSPAYRVGLHGTDIRPLLQKNDIVLAF